MDYVIIYRLQDRPDYNTIHDANKLRGVLFDKIWVIGDPSQETIEEVNMRAICLNATLIREW